MIAAEKEKLAPIACPTICLTFRHADFFIFVSLALSCICIHVSFFLYTTVYWGIKVKKSRLHLTFVFNGLQFGVYRFTFVATPYYEFHLLHRICSVPFRLLVTGCDPDTKFLRFTLVTLFCPFSSSFGTNTMIEATSASPSTTTASSRLFVTAKGGVSGSRIDLRVIGNPSAVNLGKLVSTSSPRDLLLFPPGWRGKEFLRRPCVYPPFGQI